MQTNKFRYWTDFEEAQLLKEVSEGLPIYAISKAHDRSKKAIEIRLQDIAIKMLNKGISSEEVTNKTGMSEEQINERRSQIEREKAQKQPQNTTLNPFRQIEMPSQATLDTILAEIRELKNAFKEMSEKL